MTISTNMIAVAALGALCQSTLAASPYESDDSVPQVWPRVVGYHDGEFDCSAIAHGTDPVPYTDLDSPRTETNVALVFPDEGRVVLAFVGEHDDFEKLAFMGDVFGSDVEYELDGRAGKITLPDHDVAMNGCENNKYKWVSCLDVTNTPLGALSDHDGIVELNLAFAESNKSYGTDKLTLVKKLTTTFDLTRRADAVRFCRNAASEPGSWPWQ